MKHSTHSSSIHPRLASLLGWLCAAALPCTGQELAVPRPIDAPIEHHTFRYHGGTLTPVAATDTAGGTEKTLAPCFDNACLSGFYSASFSFAPLEWVDWGFKTCGTTAIIGALDFAYSSITLDRSVGGPGVSLDLAIYAGTIGFGVLGAEIERFAMSGLPGSLDGGAAFHKVTILLDGGEEFCLPDGHIGWGYCTHEIGTGPLLVDVAACASSTGVIDVYDRYLGCPASSSPFEGSFPGGGLGSFPLTLWEDDGSAPALSTFFNGSGVNPSLLTSLTLPIVNLPWVAGVSTTFFPGTTFTAVVVSAGVIPPFSTTLGELLVDLSLLVTPIDVAAGIHTFPVPKNLSYVGLTVYAQAAVAHAAGIDLTNGLKLTIGF